MILTYKKVSIHPLNIILLFSNIERNLTFSIRDQRIFSRSAIWNESWAMDLRESMGAWATSHPGLAFQPVVISIERMWGDGDCRDRGFHASLFLEAEMAVAVGANIHGGGAAEEAADDRTQTVAFRRLTLMLFRHRSWGKVRCFKSKINKRQLI